MIDVISTMSSTIKIQLWILWLVHLVTIGLYETIPLNERQKCRWKRRESTKPLKLSVPTTKLIPCPPIRSRSNANQKKLLKQIAAHSVLLSLVAKVKSTKNAKKWEMSVSLESLWSLILQKWPDNDECYPTSNLQKPPSWADWWPVPSFLDCSTLWILAGLLYVWKMWHHLQLLRICHWTSFSPWKIATSYSFILQLFGTQTWKFPMNWG